MAAYKWHQFKFPVDMPHHVDVLLSPKGMLVGWVRTGNKKGVSVALASPECLQSVDSINLLEEGLWLGVYKSRLNAADHVLQYVKHHRE